MTETLASLVLAYGLWLIAAITFLSCLALPVPASLVLVTGGAYAANGDIGLPGALAAAYAGACAGDQVGFAIGKRGGTLLTRIKNLRGAGQALFQHACSFSGRWGKSSVFLTRWLVSPLGPYVNILSGANGMRWWVFTLFSAAGEAIWVTLYIGLGYIFSQRIGMITDLAGTISALLATLALTTLFGLAVFRPMPKPAAVSRRRQ